MGQCNKTLVTGRVCPAVPNVRTYNDNTDGKGVQQFLMYVHIMIILTGRVSRSCGELCGGVAMLLTICLTSLSAATTATL